MAVWLAVCSLAACGGGSSTPPRTEPVPSVTAPEPEPEPVADEPALAAGPPRAQEASPFADSPITPLANQLVQVADAARLGEPLPEVAFPIERHSAEDRLLHRDQEPLPREIEYVGLAMELEIALGPPGPGGGAPGGLELILFLSRHGLKILALEADPVSGARPPPRWLPVSGLAQQILSDLRADRMQRWWIGDAELAMLGPELAREVERERPGPDELRKARALARADAAVHGFRIDDVTVIARDAQSRLWALKMQFESGDVPELDAHPLVRVRRAED